MKRKFLFPLAFAALLSLAWDSPAFGAERLLLQPTELKSTWVAPNDPTVFRSQNVIVDLDVLRTAGKKLSLPLFDGEVQEVDITRTERIQERGEAWHGRIAGQPLSSVTLVALERIVVGDIRLNDGRQFELRYLSGGIHSLREIDATKFPREAQPVQVQPAKGSDLLFAGMAGTNKCLTDDTSNIDVMVVYTAAARVAAGGTDSMVALVYLSVALTNQSYVNSNINQRARLVYVTEVTYTETGNINTDLNRLTNPADGFIDNVLPLRNTYGADHTVMITENGGGFCGLAWFMNPVSPTFETNAYAVVARACAAANLSFPHELGHNMSADHDCANASSTGPYNYNRGWVELTPSAGSPWRTLMSYQSSPPSTRIPWWSNPLVNYPIGLDSMGGSCPTPPYSANNALVLNNTAATTSNFRCTSPGTGNVWMKDTWEDTGAEPDPLTAGQDMWRSPYIWVRNTQDTDLVHQHEHENPEAGQPNWAYVKLHNGGSSAATGTVEIYVTNASTTLTWGLWTLVDTVTVTGMPAHSSKVVEGSWTPLVSGHHCMVARWVSTADPMTFTETTDINYNTRQNNNIAWRNMNIVDFFDLWFEDAELLVRSTSRGRFSLQIRPFNAATSPSFIQHGEVTVNLGQKLAQRWKAGGSKGTGFKVSERGALVLTNPQGAVLENIELDPEFVDTMRLTFTRNEDTPRERFFLSVRQVDARGVAVGGVSYEIRNDRSAPVTQPGDPD
jgi:hypothetical protein